MTYADIIAKLQSQGLGGGAITQDGYIYTPMYAGTGMTESSDGTQQLTGFNRIGQGWKFGDMADTYDLSGNKTGQFETTAPDLWDKLGPALAMSLIGYAGGQALMGGLGGGGSPMSGFDAGVPTAGEVAAQNAAFADTLSPYLAKGVPQMMGQLELIPESAMAGNPVGYSGPTFGEIAKAGVGAAGAGGAGGATTAASGAASLIPGISDKALGIGATVLGGLAGKEGTPGKSSETKMDPRLDQFVYGDLLPRAQGLLGQQMPMAQQYGNQMMQMGSGLLGAGIAPNGFERFTKGRY